MTPVDHLLIFLLFVLQPLHSCREGKRNAARIGTGSSIDRISFYRQTALLEWTFLAALALIWWFFGRPMSDLGFTTPETTGWIAGAILLVALLAYTAYSMHWLGNARDEKHQEQVSAIGDVVQYLPHTRRELHYFYGVSVTAGIVEEIAFRGFVLWYLSHLMTTWYAVAISSVAFGLAHLYQGPAGAYRAGLVGFVLAATYVLSGSIWVPIVLHALLDVTQGATLFRLLRGHDDSSQPGSLA